MSEKENLVVAKPISHSYESTGSTFVPTTVDNAEVQDKPGSSSSVSFHDISYEVSRWCGRKRKVILNSARSVQCTVLIVDSPGLVPWQLMYAHLQTKALGTSRRIVTPAPARPRGHFLLFLGGALACLDKCSWLALHSFAESAT